MTRKPREREPNLFDAPLDAGELARLDGEIEMADLNASTGWEQEFVADIRQRRAAHGAAVRLTEAQRAKLRQIAHAGDPADDEGDTP